MGSGKRESIETSYRLASERYAEWGVHCDSVLARLKEISLSLHCWQGDDVVGFENNGQALGSGLAVTGNYPGRARSVAELRSDLDLALSLIPGQHRLNLHASYGEFDRKVDRNEVTVEHFRGWIDWAREHHLGLDFNPTYFAHKYAADGLTLAHPDKGIRQFWIEHGLACRRIATEMGRSLKTPCVNNVWVPDGFKDTPADRKRPRERLAASLDQIFAEQNDPRMLRDAVESKLFGIGSESYVVGSHEFYLGYAVTRQKLLCLDAGHFHPTESIADKISSVLMYVPEILLHVSRGVRWDSDHVVTLNDDLQAIAAEIVRGKFLSQVHIGLDFFDASINRIAAWTIGSRNVLKALLLFMLEPTEELQRWEAEGNFTKRLAIMEELKTMPFAAVWDYYCAQSGVPVGADWLQQVEAYETTTLSQRSSRT